MVILLFGSVEQCIFLFVLLNCDAFLLCFDLFFTGFFIHHKQDHISKFHKTTSSLRSQIEFFHLASHLSLPYFTSICIYLYFDSKLDISFQWASAHLFNWLQNNILHICYYNNDSDIKLEESFIAGVEKNLREALIVDDNIVNKLNFWRRKDVKESSSSASLVDQKEEQLPQFL